MSRADVNDRLSRISTDWEILQQAHGRADWAVRAAQELILLRYREAVQRYLNRIAGEPEAAEELFQEFAVAVMEGRLASANPDRGRFRDYVRGVLRHLVAKYHARRKKLPQPLGMDGPRLETLAAPHDDEETLDEAWRDALLKRAWAALADANRSGYEVLRFRADHPGMSSQELAAQLTLRLGRPLTAASVRQTIHRVRKQFSLLLIDEVGHSLANPTTDAVMQELADLGLLEHCRPAALET